jgi:hypothetical protein
MRLIYLLLLLFCSLSCFSQQTLRHTVYFDFDEEMPSAASHTSLVTFTDKIKTLAFSAIDVLGFTDKKGSPAYNDELSANRANAVANFLRNNLGAGITLRIDYFGKDNLVTSDDAQQQRNRRVEMVVHYSIPVEPEKKYTHLTPCFEDVETQRYNINLDDTVIISAKKGTRLKIVPGSITNKKGEIAKGKAELLIREYYDQGDILLAGLHTNSERGLLQSGGMFYMSIHQQGDTMACKTKKPVTVNMPVTNDLRGNMTVYTMDQTSDTARWNNTGRSFQRYRQSWDWPPMNDKLQDVGIPLIGFENWRIGGEMHDTYYNTRSWLIWNDDVITKKITRHIVHVDSVTLKVNLKLRFRNRGVRRFGIREFDTTFLVNYMAPMYQGFTNSLNWINCDRFLTYPYVTDFYVSTPEFSGATVMVYFKELNAIMPASRTGKDKFKIEKVPPGEKVWLIAFGRNGGQYYFSKKLYTTSEGMTEPLLMTKITQDELKEALQQL